MVGNCTLPHSSLTQELPLQYRHLAYDLHTNAPSTWMEPVATKTVCYYVCHGSSSRSHHGTSTQIKPKINLFTNKSNRFKSLVNQNHITCSVYAKHIAYTI